MEQNANYEPSKEALTLFSNLAIAQAWLCNYDELKHTPYHKHTVKQALKRACDEMERLTISLQNKMFNEGEDVFNAHVSAVEYLTNLIAKSEPSNLIVIANAIKNVEQQLLDSQNPE